MALDSQPVQPMRPSALLTVDDVASYLRVSRPTVYRWVERRAVPFHKIGGVLRFRSADIEAFVARGRWESGDNSSKV